MSNRRITRSRAKGWRMPPDAIYVGRGSRWGNPFKGAALAQMAAPFFGQRADDPARRNHALAGLYANWLAGWPSGVPVLLSVLLPSDLPAPPAAEEIRRELGGKDLACWCPPGSPCHADVLLAIANAESDTPPPPADPAPGPPPTWSCPVCGPTLVIAGPAGPECIRHGTQADIEEDPDYAAYARRPQP
ncbi:DUF4326 domain-containing protein [Nitrospirillum amazonense]|uniref:DUF4326 domain-containing protein n=1 Tax=Nitrospirillum amazonense TaxID=28077 RepID=UPI002DD43411|nr:DUF4326 domain-containing protein [Nitrospirillum amazonense]MEC4591582.1 DUF4326 domain-containing protein [Nitrospirillum amazonense]